MQNGTLKKHLLGWTAAAGMFGGAALVFLGGYTAVVTGQNEHARSTIETQQEMKDNDKALYRGALLVGIELPLGLILGVGGYKTACHAEAIRCTPRTKKTAALANLG